MYNSKVIRSVWIDGPPPGGIDKLLTITPVTFQKGYAMRAVITVIGKDMVGILAKVSTTCADANANVLEVTQSVLREFFAMVMLIDIEKMTCEFSELKERLNNNVSDMTIHVMHEDIFNSMHRI
jgi:ACT domain-containing protein